MNCNNTCPLADLTFECRLGIWAWWHYQCWLSIIAQHTSRWRAGQQSLQKRWDYLRLQTPAVDLRINTDVAAASSLLPLSAINWHFGWFIFTILNKHSADSHNNSSFLIPVESNIHSPFCWFFVSMGKYLLHNDHQLLANIMCLLFSVDAGSVKQVFRAFSMKRAACCGHKLQYKCSKSKLKQLSCTSDNKTMSCNS